MPAKEKEIFRRKAIAGDILQKRKLIPKLEPKRIGIEKGKFVVKKMKMKEPTEIRRLEPMVPKKEEFLKGKRKKEDAIPGRMSLLMRVEVSDWARGVGEWELREGAFMERSFIGDLIDELEIMYLKMYRYIIDKKSQLIPTNTGALKRSLLNSLTVHKGEISTGILIVEMGTHFPYIEHLKKMATKGRLPHVRHPKYPTKASYRKKTGRILTGDPKYASYLPGEDDEFAVHDFMSRIVSTAREAGNRIFNQGVVNIYNKWKGVFGWTQWRQAIHCFTRIKW